MTSRGIASTQKGSRYLQQLCKHWGHKFPVTVTPQRGRIDLPLGRVTLTARACELTVELKPSEGAGDDDRLRRVVEEHLNRFAFREAPLSFVWEPVERAT